MHRKEYESLEEAPPFVREQLKEYIFWIKNLGLIQAYISHRQEKFEQKMEYMHANYNDMIIKQSFDIEYEIMVMTEMISRQLGCLNKEELQKIINACLDDEEVKNDEVDSRKND